MIADCHMMLRMELVMLQAMDTALGLGGVQFFQKKIMNDYVLLVLTIILSDDKIGLEVIPMGLLVCS